MKKRPSPKWGGRRPGAGRKPKGERALVSHKARPRFGGRTAVHVVLRLDPRVNLRSPSTAGAIRGALVEGRGQLGFHLVDARARANELHFLAEAEGTRGLMRGMQGLNIRIAKAINGALKTRGRVFADHYEAFLLRSREGVAALRDAGRRFALPADAVAPPRTRVAQHFAG